MRPRAANIDTSHLRLAQTDATFPQHVRERPGQPLLLCDGHKRLSVSNSSSGRHWERDQVPAVRDPTHIVQIGKAQFARGVAMVSPGRHHEQRLNARRFGRVSSVAVRAKEGCRTVAHSVQPGTLMLRSWVLPLWPQLRRERNRQGLGPINARYGAAGQGRRNLSRQGSPRIMRA